MLNLSVQANPDLLLSSALQLTAGAVRGGDSTPRDCSRCGLSTPDSFCIQDALHVQMSSRPLGFVTAKSFVLQT